METTHRILQGDARRLPLPADSVELIVTSPPYPMIELWDDTFTSLDPDIGDALDAGDGTRAFELMHSILDAAWDELTRVLAPGGIAVINIGDATRTIDGDFRRYPNTSRITAALTDRGLRSLPDIVWRKPTNGPAKFVGSMRPPNGYVTLEHEAILPFRNGAPRRPDPDQREASAYFFEERNEWFSDLWEIQGSPQDRTGSGRDRAAAYPLEVPYRLVNMYSVQGETVLDPFCGTGTTLLAATVTARDSIGVDTDTTMLQTARNRASDSPTIADERVERRLANHNAFVEQRQADGNDPGYEAEHYDTRVVSKRARDIELPMVESVTIEGAGWTATHDRFRP